MMNFEFEIYRAGIDEQRVIANLLQLYIYEFSASLAIDTEDDGRRDESATARCPDPTLYRLLPQRTRLSDFGGNENRGVECFEPGHGSEDVTTEEMVMSGKARAVGINHIALEVGDIDETLAFYGRFLSFELESKSESAAFIYFGDQFINFSQGRRQAPDDNRHFGIAVDDKELVRETLTEMGVELLDHRFLDFFDPWGNRVEITTYTNIQYTKADHVLSGMGLGHLKKTEEALGELRKKGMAP